MTQQEILDEILQVILDEILQGQHEIYENGLRNNVVDKSHIVKVFEKLNIHEQKIEF
jgi:hypothetical protein